MKNFAENEISFPPHYQYNSIKYRYKANIIHKSMVKTPNKQKIPGYSIHSCVNFPLYSYCAPGITLSSGSSHKPRYC